QDGEAAAALAAGAVRAGGCAADEAGEGGARILDHAGRVVHQVRAASGHLSAATVADPPAAGTVSRRTGGSAREGGGDAGGAGFAAGRERDSGWGEDDHC